MPVKILPARVLNKLQTPMLKFMVRERMSQLENNQETVLLNKLSTCLTELCTKATGSVNSEMDMEFKSGLIPLAMKEIGAMTKLMARVSSSTPMVMSTMESGATIRLKAREHILTPTVPTTKVNGLTINNTEKVPKAGPMVHAMKEIMKTGRKKEMAN